MLRNVGGLSYNEAKPLGEGAFGTVYAGYLGDMKIAVKRIQRADCNNTVNPFIPLEAELLLKINNDYILQYIDTKTDLNFVYLVTELCAGTLDHYVDNKYLGPPIGDEKEILRQITRGLVYLHANQIVHRDIKPNNILISAPVIRARNGKLKAIMKLADFGLSKIMKTDRRLFSSGTNPHGARGWKAPELMTEPQTNQRRHYDFSVDIFPLGCIFGYVLSIGGKHPFGSDSTEQAYRISRMKSMLFASSDLKPPYSNDEIAVQLISSMVEMNPSSRLTALEVIEHEFLFDTRSNNTAANDFIPDCSDILDTTSRDEHDGDILPLTDEGLLDKTSEDYKALLAKVYSLAKEKSELIQRAIAWVIYNRAKFNRSEWGGNSLKGVCQRIYMIRIPYTTHRKSSGWALALDIFRTIIMPGPFAILFAGTPMIRNRVMNDNSPIPLPWTRIDLGIDNWLPAVYQGSDPSCGSTKYMDITNINETDFIDSTRLLIPTVKIGSLQFFKEP